MRLTPGPLHLLVAIARGAVLRDTFAYSERWLALRWPDRFDGYRRIHARAANTLIKQGLVERLNEFDWRLSSSGRAWLSEMGIAAEVDKARRRPVTGVGP